MVFLLSSSYSSIPISSSTLCSSSSSSCLCSSFTPSSTLLRKLSPTVCRSWFPLDHTNQATTHQVEPHGPNMAGPPSKHMTLQNSTPGNLPGRGTSSLVEIDCIDDDPLLPKNSLKMVTNLVEIDCIDDDPLLPKNSHCLSALCSSLGSLLQVGQLWPLSAPTTPTLPPSHHCHICLSGFASLLPKVLLFSSSLLLPAAAALEVVVEVPG